MKDTDTVGFWLAILAVVIEIAIVVGIVILLKH